MNQEEAEQFKVAWENAKPISEMGLKEDFEGGINGWQIRMDKEGWYLKHLPCGTLEILSVMTTPPRLVRLMKDHNERCTALSPKT